MREMNAYQEAYFKFMTQSREHVFYVSEHIAMADKWNRRVNMFMAIASSSSIGAWVVWQKLSWIWASVIAGSHVVGAIRDHLPFQRRLSVLHPLRNELERLSIEVEKAWYSVANGELTEEQIHLNTMQFKARKAALEEEHMGSIVLPERQGLIRKASGRNCMYFQNAMLGDTKCRPSEAARTPERADRANT